MSESVFILVKPTKELGTSEAVVVNKEQILWIVAKGNIATIYFDAPGYYTLTVELWGPIKDLVNAAKERSETGKIGL